MTIIQRLLQNQVHEAEPNYVVAVRFVAALLNALLIAFAKVPSEAIAARASNTSNSAYSVKSWPSSSFHKRIK